MSAKLYTSMADAIQELTKRGFTADFEFLDQAFRDVDSGRTFKAEDLTIVEHYRFEGASDPIMSRKYIWNAFHPGQAPEQGDERVGHGQEMGATGLGVRDPPFRSGETHIVPPHGQHLGAARAGPERGQQDRTDRAVRLLRNRLKEPGEFLGLDKPIARFLSKELDAGRGILTRVEAPVPGQIEHLAE